MSLQVKTRLVSTKSVIGSSAFKEGMLDYLMNNPIKDDWESTSRKHIIDQQWNYERGRIFCLYLVKKGLTNLEIKVGKRVTSEAVYAYARAKEEGYFGDE